MEYGHAKDDKGFQYLTTLSRMIRIIENHCFMKSTRGSIVDVSQLQCMLDKAKVRLQNMRVYSRQRLLQQRKYRFMDKCNYDFVIMIRDEIVAQ